MNNPLFDEAEIVPGTKYKFGDWKSIAVHDDKNIKGFFGDYRWASNFHYCLVCHDTLPFPTSEHAYMFAKLDQSTMSDETIKMTYDYVFALSAREVKKWGRSVKLRPDWESIKYDTMGAIVFDKFYRNMDLRKKLLETGEKYIEETNWWGDVTWGVDIRKGGTNWLGKILMNVREFWKPIDFPIICSSSQVLKCDLPPCDSFEKERSEIWDFELKNPLP